MIKYRQLVDSWTCLYGVLINYFRFDVFAFKEIVEEAAPNGWREILRGRFHLLPGMIRGRCLKRGETPKVWLVDAEGGRVLIIAPDKSFDVCVADI